MILLWILIKKNNHPQVYLECKYRVKIIQISRFIDTELKSDSEPSDSDSDLDSEKIGVKVDNNNIRKIWFWF